MGIDRVNEAINKILQMFESGQLPEAIARTVIHQDKSLPSSQWSLGNQLLMIIAGTADARGFKQWQTVGRQVKKGAKAFYILGPCTKKYKAKVTNENGKEEEKEQVYITGYKGIPVFKYEDTEGSEINRPDYTPSTLPPLYEVAKKHGVNVKYGPFTKRFYGYFRPQTDEIMLCTHDVSVFFHELGHAVHHTFRPLKLGQIAEQEIVAETVAAVLCQLYGYEGYNAHNYQYIKHYAGAKDGKETARAIMRVLSDVQRVLQVIFNAPVSKEENHEKIA